MAFDPSVDRVEREVPENRGPGRRRSIKDAIYNLMRQNCHRWWSPYELSQLIQARSVARRMREVMEDDRDSVLGHPEHERRYRREFEERTVKNARDGQHKEYRWKGRQDPRPPGLFD